MRAGWQQPARRRHTAPKCLHFGLVVASLSIGLHDSGDVWVCTCGARFVVVSNAGSEKRFELDRRKP